MKSPLRINRASGSTQQRLARVLATQRHPALLKIEKEMNGGRPLRFSLAAGKVGP